MTQRIERIAVHQTAKVIGVMYGAFGLIFMPFALIAFAYSEGFSPLLGVGILLAPLWYGLMVYLVVALWILLYNFVASKVGGIEIRLSPESAPTPR